MATSGLYRDRDSNLISELSHCTPGDWRRPLTLREDPSSHSKASVIGDRSHKSVTRSVFEDLPVKEVLYTFMSNPGNASGSVAGEKQRVDRRPRPYERVFVPFCHVGTCFVSFWMCYQSVIRESCFTDPTSNDRRMFQIWSSKVEPV